VVFSPDGKMLAAAGTDNTVQVWDLEDNRPKGPRTLRGHSGAVTNLAFSSNNNRLASTSIDGEARVWDPRSTGKSLVTVIHNSRRKVRTMAVAFTPDNGHLITGGDDHHLHVWELGPKLQRSFTLEHASGVRCVAVSRHDKYWDLLTGTSDGRLRLWRIPNNMILQDEHPQVDIRGHALAVQAVKFDGTGARFGSVGRDGLVKLWRETGRELATLRGLNSIAFLRDGKQLLTPQLDGTVASWDSSLRRSLGVVKDLPRPLTFLAFAPNGQRLAALTDERKVALWETDTMKPMPLPTTNGEVFAVGFGTDSQCLVLRGGSGGSLLLSLATGPEASVNLIGLTGSPVASAFSQDGRRLALVGSDRTVSTWDITDGHRLSTTAIPGEGSVRIALSNDGGRVAILTEREIAARNGETGQLLFAREKPAGLGTVAMSPNGLRIAMAGKDGVVRVWDVDKAEDDGRTLFGQEGNSLSLAFTPEGTRLATMGKDGVVRIWDPASEQELLGLVDQPVEILALAFAPDGRLAMSGKDKSLQMWDGRPLP
jgi:WD40 repeat protein